MTTVTLVLDACYGARLTSLDAPIWVCDSPVNRPVVERLWANPERAPAAVTVFTRVRESDAEVCADILATIDEHHPGWTQLVVIGALASSELRECFAALAPGELIESSSGVTFARAHSP